MEIQPQLILLQKTLFNIEGLGRELYPQLDLWKTAHPVLRRWMDEQVGARAAISAVRENLPQIREALRELPGAIRQISEQAAKGEFKIDMDSADLREIRRALSSQQRQRFWLALSVTALVASTLVFSLGTSVWVGWGLLAAGSLCAFFGRPGA